MLAVDRQIFMRASRNRARALDLFKRGLTLFYEVQARRERHIAASTRVLARQ